ncbi:hypothetical protein ACFVT5_42820 [Streptomyces sp. NPDC058001]|uniref:hypothetical protein n=1 Tax=Streptomyces sp. NPDC058001 TaxID=3346300 RepID=UPI0036E9576C
MSRSGSTPENAAALDVTAAGLLGSGGAGRDAQQLEGTGLVACRERELAVSHWLLGAADDTETARAQWREQGIALLGCGGILSAVRIPAPLVWAAADAEDLETADGFLRRWFDGGAVFMDLHSHLYYVLVPGFATWRWSDREFPGVGCLGRDHFLGVPEPQLTRPRGRAYWSVPMDSPAELTYLDEVVELVRRGRAAQGGGYRRSAEDG